VVVTDGQVEIRYVLPTSPDGRTALFASCVKTISILHLRQTTATRSLRAMVAAE